MEAKNLPLIYTRKDNRNQTGSRQFPFLPKPDIHRVENKRGILFLSKARFFWSLCNDLTLLSWLLKSYCNFLTTHQYFLSFLSVCLVSFTLHLYYTIIFISFQFAFYTNVFQFYCILLPHNRQKEKAGFFASPAFKAFLLNYNSSFATSFTYSVIIQKPFFCVIVFFLSDRFHNLSL